MLANGADPSPLIRELSQLTTQNIDNSLIFGGDLDRATDIMTAIVQHNSQTDSSDMTRHDVEVHKTLGGHELCKAVCRSFGFESITESFTMVLDSYVNQP